jgi:hypothetical protein
MSTMSPALQRKANVVSSFLRSSTILGERRLCNRRTGKIETCALTLLQTSSPASFRNGAQRPGFWLRNANCPYNKTAGSSYQEKSAQSCAYPSSHDPAVAMRVTMISAGQDWLQLYYATHLVSIESALQGADAWNISSSCSRLARVRRERTASTSRATAPGGLASTQLWPRDRPRCPARNGRARRDRRSGQWAPAPRARRR